MAQAHRSPRIVILGTGMGALGAAHRLEAESLRPVLYDANPYFGGHTASFEHAGGWTFDDGPHVSFTKDERIRDLFTANVDGEVLDVRAHIDNYWHGILLDHPVQIHMHGLPTDLITRVITDFVAAHEQTGVDLADYELWLRAAYGDTFAETFPMVYGLKYHTTTPSNMTTEWLGPRMYRPSLAEVLQGALARTTSDTHYVTSFRYPLDGGFTSFIRPYATRFDVRLARGARAIDPQARRVTFTDGTTESYEQLVSSVPLPALIPLIAGAPARVREAASRLAFSSAVMVNIGVPRDDLSDAHIRYIYDQDLIFVRLNYPHLLSPRTVPPGHGAIQAEIYFSDKYRPLTRTPESLVDETIADLRRSGLLREDDRIAFREARYVRYANVIYDHDRAAALATVRAFLDETGVITCGRYGAWDHAWTDEAFISGEQAAERAIAALERSTRPAISVR